MACFQPSRPLQPLPTGVQPRLTRLKSLRAVLFDVYGTMLISGSGDVGTSIAGVQSAALSAAFEAVGLPSCPDGEAVASTLTNTIREYHRRARRRGIEFPEVEMSARIKLAGD